MVKADLPEDVDRQYARNAAASALHEARKIVDESIGLTDDQKAGFLISIGSEWRWLYDELG